MAHVVTQETLVLKGTQFIERIEPVFRKPLPRCPLPDLKYKRILIPGLSGGELHFSMLGLIGQALRIRGAEVTTLSCDSMLPACAHRKVDHHESACTRWCHKNAGPFARAMRLPQRWYSEFISSHEKLECRESANRVSPGDIPGFTWQGISLGELILQSVSSHFKVGYVDLDDEPMRAQAYQFLLAAMYMTIISRRALTELKIDKVFTDNGLHVDWGVMRARAGQAGIPVDVVQLSPRPNCLQFKIDRADRASVPAPQWSTWRQAPLTARQEQALDEYLAERDLVPYLYKAEKWSDRITDPHEARRRLGLPDHRPAKVFVMFPNVAFDVVAAKGNPLFGTIAEWIAQTVRFFRRHPSHRLVIKSHPGENHLGAKDPVRLILANDRQPPPANVHCIGPESGITAQCALRLSDVALVYSSTVSVEAAALGVPIIMVGDGLHAGRGIAEHPATAAAYLDLLEGICRGRRAVEAPAQIGRRYAYFYFFRSALELRPVELLDHEVTAVRLKDAQELAPGADPTLDMICRAILFDEPITNPYA